MYNTAPLRCSFIHTFAWPWPWRTHRSTYSTNDLISQRQEEAPLQTLLISWRLSDSKITCSNLIHSHATCDPYSPSFHHNGKGCPNSAVIKKRSWSTTNSRDDDKGSIAAWGRKSSSTKEFSHTARGSRPQSPPTPRTGLWPRIVEEWRQFEGNQMMLTLP